MYVRAGRPAFAWPYAGVHRSTSLMSSSLLLQQSSACLIRLTCIVFVMGGKWPYSWYLVGYCRQDLFNIALNKCLSPSLSLSLHFSLCLSPTLSLSLFVSLPLFLPFSLYLYLYVSKYSYIYIYIYIYWNAYDLKFHVEGKILHCDLFNISTFYLYIPLNRLISLYLSVSYSLYTFITMSLPPSFFLSLSLSLSIYLSIYLDR